MNSNMRIGNGIDVHPLVKDRKLILGGVEIQYDFGCDGHSDGDVLTHSIIDALLGAINKGDIGEHFPSSNDVYKDSSSIIFLDTIYNQFIHNKWDIINIDATILLQDPPIKPYIQIIKDNLCQQIPSLNNISIKATTTDHLGFIGKKHGIASFTTCLLSRIDG